MENLAEELERLVMGGKSRDKIRGENGQVARVAPNVSTKNCLAKWCRVFDGWGWQLEKCRYKTVGLFYINIIHELKYNEQSMLLAANKKSTCLLHL